MFYFILFYWEEVVVEDQIQHVYVDCNFFAFEGGISVVIIVDVVYNDLGVNGGFTQESPFIVVIASVFTLVLKVVSFDVMIQKNTIMQVQQSNKPKINFGYYEFWHILFDGNFLSSNNDLNPFTINNH